MYIHIYMQYNVYNIVYILHMYIYFIYIGIHICFRYIVWGTWESDLCGKIYLDFQLRPWRKTTQKFTGWHG